MESVLTFIESPLPVVLFGICALLITLAFRAFRRDEARRARRTPAQIEDEFDQEIW